VGRRDGRAAIPAGIAPADVRSAKGGQVTRMLAIQACLAAVLAAPLASQTEPIIELSEHGFRSYDLSEAYPQWVGPLPGEVNAGGAITMELRYNVPVEVRLVGATSDGRLPLRQANGAVTTIALHCSWSDPDAPASQRTWNVFPCDSSGTAGPPTPPAGTVMRVFVRAFATALPTTQATAAAGFYSNSVYFRVDAR
jgi:hypothetical protein